MSAACAAPAVTYRRREPETSALYEAVRANLNTFLATRGVPGYVRRALRRYLDCGVLAKGFVRVRCPACKEENLVAFSCKDRSFCPSCTARRGAETAANLVDHVLPHVPLRQWVLALPPDLHLRVAADPELETKVLAALCEELEALLRATTGTGDAARGGSATFLQHFGSTLNLHVHFHVLALDGVYVPGATAEGPPTFVRAPEPTTEEVRGLCERVATRVNRLLVRRPWREPDDERQAPVFRVFGAEPQEPAERRLHARVGGFDLHASAPFEASERVAVERFLRYCLRGPIASGRLKAGPRDLLTYTLKTPKADGTTELVLSPLALLERLARLVPHPGRHLVRYHGVLANAAAWRKHVVPPGPDEVAPLLRRIGPRRIDRANLLRRVYLLEVLTCACGGTRRVIASLEEGPAARKLLRHLGLPDAAPTVAPARVDQYALWPTGPPANEGCDPPSADDVQRSPAGLSS